MHVKELLISPNKYVVFLVKLLYVLSFVFQQVIKKRKVCDIELSFVVFLYV